MDIADQGGRGTAAAGATNCLRDGLAIKPALDQLIDWATHQLRSDVRSALTLGLSPKTQYPIELGLCSEV